MCSLWIGSWQEQLRRDRILLLRKNPLRVSLRMQSCQSRQKLLRQRRHLHRIITFWWPALKKVQPQYACRPLPDYFMNAPIVWDNNKDSKFPNPGLCIFRCDAAQNCRYSSLLGESGQRQWTDLARWYPLLGGDWAAKHDDGLVSWLHQRRVPHIKWVI